MIIIANFLSPHLDSLARQYAAALEEAVGEKTTFEPRATLDEFREGRIDIALVCGLAYSLLHDADPEHFAPVAAPLVDDERGRGEAVYGADIVVPAGSDARGLADLSGARFAYNEAVSFSGYRALEHELVSSGRSWRFFGERLATGSHRGSLEALVEGRADAATIDSHVLMLERRREPSLAEAVRVIDSLGPYPAPPLAFNRIGCDVSEDYLFRLLEQVPAGVFEAVGITGWQRVDDVYYDPIRDVARELPDLNV